MTLEGLKELLEALRKNNKEVAKTCSELTHYDTAYRCDIEAQTLRDIIMYITCEEHYQKTREIFGLGEDK